MTPSLTRHHLRERIDAALRATPGCVAAWEGGSTSFGRDDAWSDLDLGVVVEDGAEAAAFGAVEAALASAGTVDLRWVVPRTLYSGHQQRFYRLTEAGPYALVDLTVMPRSSPPFFTERARHGEPSVLFDPEGLSAPGAVDHPDLDARRAAAVEQAVLGFRLFSPFVAKEVARGRSLDALAFYQRFVVSALATVLRSVHDPLRFDFGLRYLDHDLPPEAAARLARLAFVASPDQLADAVEEATAWLDTLAGGWRPTGAAGAVASCNTAC